MIRERLRQAFRSCLPMWLGLVIVLAYWLAIRPPASPQGYIEDMCSADQNRQMMADNLRDYGGPRFKTDFFMAPTGASVPFMSWSMERDWLGGYVWLADSKFPFLWVYVGVSLLIAFLGVGFLTRQMGLGIWPSWGLAALTVVFHIPRHLKLWHHFEHVPEHWVYLNFFFDAWLWLRLWRDNRWSLSLELWRLACFLGTFAIAGYFWGPVTLEWAWLRLCLFGLLFTRRQSVVIERRVRPMIPALVVLALELGLVIRWLVPLVHEASQYTDIWQPISWFADLYAVFQPVWWNGFMHVIGVSFRPFDWSETIVTVGWVYWVPALLGAWLLGRRREGLRVLPFFVLLVVGLLYLSIPGEQGYGSSFQFALQAIIPFFKFFRVASRWGLIFPALLGAIIALEWPELSAWARQGGWVKRIAIGLFFVSSLTEASWLLVPVHYLPPMSDRLNSLLAKVKEAPGTTVLDLPFCTVGGNGLCGGPGYGECPNYPEATAGACFREWHDKKVYGLYQARMTPAHCALYEKAPYSSWFTAWKEQRCFTDSEFDAFCAYLGDHSELAAIMLYPDIWIGPQQKDCWDKFEKHLGAPLDEAWFFTGAERGGKGVRPTRVFRFAPRCVRG